MAQDGRAAPDTRSHSLISWIQTALCGGQRAGRSIATCTLIRGGEDRIEKDTAAFCGRWWGSRAGNRADSVGGDGRSAASGSIRICDRATAQEATLPAQRGATPVWVCLQSRSPAGMSGDLFDFLVTSGGRRSSGRCDGKGVGAGMQMVATQTRPDAVWSWGRAGRGDQRGERQPDAPGRTQGSL